MIRLEDAEKEALDRVAKHRGLPTASWARMELLRLSRAAKNGNGSQETERGHLVLLSLFCGPGGLDEGFRQAGFTTRVAIDNDDESVKTFALNHPEARTETADIAELTLEEIDEFAGEELHPVGVIGGPPCQSFSVSNVHQRRGDPRHRLPEAYARLLGKLNERRPLSFFVFENVPGLLGKKHRRRYNKFRRMFQECGFELQEHLLDAKDFGVPQERPRIFIVGINREQHPDAVWEPPPQEGRMCTVRETIAGLPEPVHNGKGLDPETFPVHPNHWCLVPRSRKFENADLQEGQMYGRSFRTLAWDKPSWTVAYGHREVHVHPKGHRRLSMYEAMLLQTFPPTYRLTGNLSAQIRMISEAVPPRLAWHLAIQIRKCLGI